MFSFVLLYSYSCYVHVVILLRVVCVLLLGYVFVVCIVYNDSSRLDWFGLNWSVLRVCGVCRCVMLCCRCACC